MCAYVLVSAKVRVSKRQCAGGCRRALVCVRVWSREYTRVRASRTGRREIDSCVRPQGNCGTMGTPRYLLSDSGTHSWVLGEKGVWRTSTAVLVQS